MTARSFRVGADIGGTFTDIVFLENGETLHTLKRSSTPDDYSRGIVAGILELLEQLGGRPDEIEEVIHATTVATNAILEGKGASTSLLTTRGFRDVVEIGRLRVPELYNLNYDKPTPLVPRRRRYEVAERVAADGAVVLDLDEGTIREAGRRIAADGSRAVAISYLHSYANPEHERRTRQLLADLLGPDIFVSCSSDVLPEIREYERTSTVVVNAYLGPVVRSYLRAVEERLRAAGIGAPLQIMQSSGGVMGVFAASEKPACIIESGPAAGVIAAARIGGAAGYRDLITIDMGGTTAKAAIIEGGLPAMTTEYEVGAGINLSSRLVKGGGHAVKLPFIDVSEIGAGGGSIVRVDPGGFVQVGPDSAGSSPGPACYGAGGVEPTLTDALVTLGFLNPTEIAGGAVRLDADLSHRALTEAVCRPAGLDLQQAAYGAFAIAASTMMRAVKAVSTYRGRDPREFTLFAFGGNGPIMANEIAELLDMRQVVVPPSPGVFSALGLLFSETEHEFLQTFFGRLATLDPDALANGFATLETKAEASLRAEGYDRADVLVRRRADLRYAGQAYELTVDVAASPQGGVDGEALAAAFHREHARTYGHASERDAIELVNLRVVGTVRAKDGRTYRPPPMARPEGGAPSRERRAWFGPAHGARMTPILARADLLAGPRRGPLIIEEYDATCVVRPGWMASLDAAANIVLGPEGRP